MKKGRKTITTVVEEPEDAPESLGPFVGTPVATAVANGTTKPQRERQEELRQTLEESLSLFPEAKAKVYRFERDGEKAFIDEMPSTELAERGDSAIREYGPGRYIIYLHGPIGDGTRKGIQGNPIRITIGDVRNGKPGDVPVTPNAPSSGASLLDQVFASSLITMLKQMNDMSTMQMELMRKTIAEGNRPAERDPLLGQLLTVLLQKPTVDPMQQAREIAELATKHTGRGGMAEVLTTMETIEKIKAFKIVGGEEGTGTMDLLGKGLDTLGQYLQARNAAVGQQPQPGPVMLPPASPDYYSPAAPVPVAPVVLLSPSGEPVPPSLQVLQPLVPDLKRWAQQNRDPQWAAETILYDVPPGFHAQLGAMLQGDGVVSQIGHTFPELSPFANWLETVRAALVDMITGDEPATA